MKLFFKLFLHISKSENDFARNANHKTDSTTSTKRILSEVLQITTYQNNQDNCCAEKNKYLKKSISIQFVEPLSKQWRLVNLTSEEFFFLTWQNMSSSERKCSLNFE